VFKSQQRKWMHIGRKQYTELYLLPLQCGTQTSLKCVSTIYLSACRRLCLRWPWLVLLLRGVFFCFLVLHANKKTKIKWQKKSIRVRPCHHIKANKTNSILRKENTDQNVSTRSVYKTKTGITNKAAACKER